MTRLVVWVYRVIYMFILIVFGVDVSPRDGSWQAVALAVYALSFLAQFSLVLLTGITHRFLRWPVWAVTATCCVAYGLSAGGGFPFVWHEWHTFDPDAMATEERIWHMASVPWFVLSLLWLLTFPVVHELESALHRSGGSVHSPEQAGG
jgi:hypothetical protein